MIQAAFLLLIGAVLLVSLLLLARRSIRPEGGAEALIEARHALASLQTGLLSSELVERLFAADDFEFVALAAPHAARSQYRRERKELALEWVRQVRLHIRRLRRFHLGAARFYARLSFRSELSLAADFAGILVACRAVQVLVYFGGPVVASRMLGWTAFAASKLCRISERALAFLSAPDSTVARSMAC